MTLEKGIIDWSATRPAWQRQVLRRVADGAVLNDADYDGLLEDLLASKEVPETTFGIEQLPEVGTSGPAVTLVSVENPEHVNALSSDKPLTLETTGITIIYGNNGTGKSGYARLLKNVARARHREEILSDVFRDTVREKPKALLKIRVGTEEKPVAWPNSTLPELQHMLFYDKACGDAFASSESDFPYRPSALFVMDGLIEACVAIRSRVDKKLDENMREAKSIPAVHDDLKSSPIGKYLLGVSSKSTTATLDTILESKDASAAAIEELKTQEARLRSTDTNKEKQKLTRLASKLDLLRNHVSSIHKLLDDAAIAALEVDRSRVKSLEEAARLLASSFEAEPLRGVGTAAWKEMWEAARQFSETLAYASLTFPVIADDAKCVLCQQLLEAEAKDRLSRFDTFVRNDIQTQLAEARTKVSRQVKALNELLTTPDTVESNLKDLEADSAALVLETRACLDNCEAIRATLIKATADETELPRSGLAITDIVSKLEDAAKVARATCEGLSDPAKAKEMLSTINTKRLELELLAETKKQYGTIASELERLKERELLEATKSGAATTTITKKVLELSEAHITEVVRDTFTRETERLQLERVTIAKTRGDLGALKHQPKLVGARQDVTLPRVFSEGERTALGLASFFTEAKLDASQSALILDDPVSSLDHVRRALVATRLAEFSTTRQVVVFTHDVSFVADLKREAKGRGVSICERSVNRSRGPERKPGTCGTQHPWKAKDATQRIGELREGLSRIKRESKDWDESTYEKEVGEWAGSLSETWECIFSQEIVGVILAEGATEVRPMMVKVLSRFKDADEKEFQASYSRVSQWAKRHHKSAPTNYVAPEAKILEEELTMVTDWLKRVKSYQQG